MDRVQRRDFLIAAGVLLAAPLAEAQQSTKPARIGYLSTSSSEIGGRNENAFKQGLRDLGYIEGKNVLFETRWASGKAERLPALAKEIVAFKPDVIMVGNPDAALAAHDASATIPIVAATISDTLGSGLINSLARPGGQITGLSSIIADTTAKRLELLLAVVPKLSRVAVLWYSNDPNRETLKNLQTAAQKVNVNVLLIEAKTPAEIESGFARIVREKVRALVVLSGGLLLVQNRQIAKLAIDVGIPSVFPFREFVEAGGLMSYGSNLVPMFRRAATYVDKILKGAKPGDLPIEQVTTLELVVNLKTAKALGITIPQSILLRADEVIE